MNSLQAVQQGLLHYQQASDQMIQATTPQTPEQMANNKKNPTPSIETAATNMVQGKEMSEASIKALKTEDSLIGHLLDIMA